MELDLQRIEKLKELSGKLGYGFRDINLLNKALTHRSYANEMSSASVKDNERLEFLGDSVLDLIVSRYLFFKGPDFKEGDLSRIRSHVVNENALASIAKQLSLGDYLLLGRGEDSTGGREKNSLLSNAFEAVIAAIYLDSSFETSYHILLEILKESMSEAANPRSVQDYKGNLQKYIKIEKGTNPYYKLIDESGPDHSKTFTVQVCVNNELFGIGVGRTKKEAEQEAAKVTFEALKNLEEPGLLQ